MNTQLAPKPVPPPASPPPTYDPVGQPCYPDDPTPRAGLSCQVTGQKGIIPPRLVNALKGDSVLTRACGEIGGMLAEVSPPQKYSHVGIMARDHFEILNSTAYSKRMQQFGEDPGFHNVVSDGIDEEVLRYGFPGAIRQWIADAYGATKGTLFVDPKSGKNIRIGVFHRDAVECNGGWWSGEVAIQPLVLKPKSGAGVDARRAELRLAADSADALSRGPGMHYRFYTYTNGPAMNDLAWAADPTEATTSWAEGTLPSMCSGFIWASFKRAGITLEGALEATDIAGGAEPPPGGGPDGLYFYQQGERRTAAYAMYSGVYTMVKDAADLKNAVFGPPVVWIQDGADDVANQTLNCFASDWCNEDAKDSRDWRNPGTGTTVSPDDMMFWDVYSEMERVVYRSSRFEQLSTWQASEGTGSVQGTVEGWPDNASVVGASITLMGIEKTSDANGAFLFEAIPAGSYEAEASGWVNGKFVSAKAQVTVQDGVREPLTILIGEPDHRYRKVRVFTPDTYGGGIYVFNDPEGGSNH